MAQLFLLEVSDGNDTVTFFSPSQGSGDRFQLADAGFQIGLPKTKRSFGVLRPGVGIMTQEDKSARECTIKFSVYASTRGGVTSKIAKLNSILKNVSQRARTGYGERVELKYSWEGSNKATYLEIYGGEFIYPDNIWSVEGMHAQIYGEYVIANLELKIWLSPEAYAISLRSTSMTAVPLSNSYGSGNTSGLKVVNTGTNWVEISGNAIEGDTPVPCKISVDPGDANFSTFLRLYIGLQRQLDGYPINLFYDSSDIARTTGGNVSGGGYGGSHITQERSQPRSDAPYGTWNWEYNNTKGLFYAFVNHYTLYGGGAYRVAHAVGYSDYITYGIVVQGDWFKASNDSASPLGIIQMPPGPPELAEKGTFHEDLWVTLLTSNSDWVNVGMDYLSFLPIGDGVRIWKIRITTAGGTAIDDGWEGIQYLDSGSKIWTPFSGILSPIKLIPGDNQRLYFQSSGPSGVSHHQRELKIRVSYIPTYTTMVE